MREETYRSDVVTRTRTGRNGLERGMKANRVEIRTLIRSPWLRQNEESGRAIERMETALRKLDRFASEN
jgi:hypothetical protein